MGVLLPCVIPPASPDRGRSGSLGDPLLDAYLEFVTARSRPNTVLATWIDLKVFFAVVGKPVAEVSWVDVLGFVTAQRTGVAYLPERAWSRRRRLARARGCRCARSGAGCPRSAGCTRS